MGTGEFFEARDGNDDSIVLHVDDRGRITIPKSIRERLSIEPDSDVSAHLEGSTLTIDPKPSTRLQTVTGNRDEWRNSTPVDAGESLFGSVDTGEVE